MAEWEMTHEEWKMFNGKKKQEKIYSENRFYCKCGHSISIFSKTKKVLCTHCGKWVFREKKDEFNYRLKEKMKNVI